MHTEGKNCFSFGCHAGGWEKGDYLTYYSQNSRNYGFV
uniref:Uncharacterized protein n=1 Tax=Rhizophora mucronata TaxID=61149 RepID=A0A2P2N901_RHIMU